MGKSSPKPPPPPDYAGAAREQGTANLEAARLTARLSNPNISTPLGGQRVTFGRQATNQAAYDAAMKQYQQALQQYEQRITQPISIGNGGFLAQTQTLQNLTIRAARRRAGKPSRECRII
jgi:hypothetical protein